MPDSCPTGQKTYYRQNIVIGIVAFLMITVVTILVFTQSNFPQKVKRKLHLWNAFHYVLGTKYFKEVGYFDLYKAVLLADQEERKIFSPRDNTRDQHTYKKIPIAQAIKAARSEGIRERFTHERWNDFKADMETILRQRRDEFWKLPIADRGFNPSPAWLILHEPLLNKVGKLSEYKLMALCYAQLPFYLVVAILLWWAFGLRTTGLFFLFFILYIGNGSRVVGGYFTYDWFFLTIGAVALIKKGHPIAGGPLLGYAAMMRGFPALLALYPTVQWIIAILRWKCPEKRHTLFLVSLALSCILLFLLSGTTSRGLSSWMDWKEKVQVHSAHQGASSARVGLLFLFANSTMKPVKGEVRLERIAQNKWKYRVAQVALLLLSLVAMRRRDDYNGMLLGLFSVFFLFLISRYYFAFAALFVTWSQPDMPRKIKSFSTGYLVGLLVLVQVLRLSPLTLRGLYYILNAGMTIYIVFILVMFILEDRKKARSYDAPQPSDPRLGDTQRIPE